MNDLLHSILNTCLLHNRSRLSLNSMTGRTSIGGLMKNLKPNTLLVFRVKDNAKVYIDTRTGNIRKRWWTKGRIPGTVRPSRMPGGSAFRNNWEG